jgi:pSer/pThr/pTyr-binding forkhead associated (FHA) protein
VSRRHAYLQMIAGRVLCVDLESRTGVHWDDGLARSGWIDDGRAIQVGPFRLRLCAQPQDGADGESRSAASKLSIAGLPRSYRAPAVTLHALGRNAPTSWLMKRAMVLIGSSEKCQFRLTGPTISNFHCSIVRTPVGPWIIDLLGFGGISVNGFQVSWKPLNDGDELQVGGYSIQVRCGPPEEVKGSVDGDGAHEVIPLARSRKTELVVARPTAAGLVPEIIQPVLGPQGIPPAAGAESVGASINSLLDRLGAMQRQMAEENRQTLLMLFQVLGALRRDQVQLIRAEFGRLEELNQDVQSLKEGLLERTDPPETPAPMTPDPEMLASSAWNTPSPMAHSISASRAAMTSEAIPEKPGTADREPLDGASGEDQTYIIDLHRRLSELHGARQGSWQRLFKLLIGSN